MKLVSAVLLLFCLNYVSCWLSLSKTKTICERKESTILCPTAYRIKIYQASYGRSNRLTCRHTSIKTTSCSSKLSLSKVKAACSGKQSCRLRASNSIFGDPCVGTYKYLRVVYRCAKVYNKPSFGRINVCEGKRSTLGCPRTRVLRITRVIYGRTDRRTCPHSSIKTTKCSTIKPFPIVSGQCNGRQACSVASTNSLYGDPCVGTYKYLTVSYQCIVPPKTVIKKRVVCELKKSTIRCPRNTVLTIYRATYGRTSRAICPHKSIKTTSCSTSRPLPVVRRQCQGRQACTVRSLNSLYGDPCRGTYKYLTVSYRCIRKGNGGGGNC